MAEVTLEPKVYTVEVTQETQVIEIASSGVQGIPGPQGTQGTTGPTGPTGATGATGAPGTADKTQFSYVFEQQTISTTWAVNHNLGYRPAVFVRDYGNNNMECDIQHTNVNSLTLTFLSENSGYAYLT